VTIDFSVSGKIPSITRIAKLSAPEEKTIQLTLHALSALSTNQKRHLILFAQAPDLGHILRVDRKELYLILSLRRYMAEFAGEGARDIAMLPVSRNR
jgi:hypothetical protein